MHPSLICDHILRSDINITPFCSLLTLYQLVYAVITVTYKINTCNSGQ